MQSFAAGFNPVVVLFAVVVAMVVMGQSVGFPHLQEWVPTLCFAYVGTLLVTEQKTPPGPAFAPVEDLAPRKEQKVRRSARRSRRFRSTPLFTIDEE